jgi:hypothetical protein
MRVFLLWALVCGSSALASGTSVCLEWSDAGVPVSASPDGSVADKQGVDAGLYRAPGPQCLRWGFKAYDQGGCSAAPRALVLLALALARRR